LTDVELLNGARQGDAEAWRTLYSRYLPFVWRQAHALVGDTHAAEDITSEVMVALLKNIRNLETEVPKLGGWLRAVVRCKAADYQRAVIRSRAKLTNAANRATANDSASQMLPSAPLEVVETRRRVLLALDSLPERHRIVLEWKYFEALPVRDIAERLGETEKAVESVLYRARREFRRLFDSQRLLDAVLIRNGEVAAEGKTHS
jgi:RNA polymerase sigma-70 factor, ECF subfamily